MRQKIKIAALSAILLAALFLCSCRARPCLSIDCSDLPGGMELKLLVQIDEGDRDYRDKPRAGEIPIEYMNVEAVTELDSGLDSSCTDSLAAAESPTAEEKYAAFLEDVNAVGAEHLYNYNEDGWRSADYYIAGDAYTSVSSKFYFPTKYYHTEDFVSAYPKLRVAAVDESGRVCKVSDTAEMTPDDKFAVYTGLDYSYESNTLTPNEPQYRRINGKKPVHYLIEFWILLAVCDLVIIPLLVAMIGVYIHGTNHRSVGFLLLFILLSIGNVLFFASYLIMELVPKFNLKNNGFTLSDISNLLFVNALWIVELIVFCVIWSRPRKLNRLNDPYAPVDMNRFEKYNRKEP